MIQWPAEDKVMSDGAQHGLMMFRQTAAAQELEEDAHVWRLEASSWIDELPIRLIWSDEEGDELCFVVDEPGSWRLFRYETLHVDSDKEDPLTALGVAH
jgi:hypothetical protein